MILLEYDRAKERQVSDSELAKLTLTGCTLSNKFKKKKQNICLKTDYALEEIMKSSGIMGGCDIKLSAKLFRRCRN
jgi:hypothetical protein